MSIFLSNSEIRPSFTAEVFFRMDPIFQVRKSGNLIKVLKSFRAEYPLNLIDQISLWRIMSTRWEEMKRVQHPGCSPRHYIFLKLRFCYFLYNSSVSRKSLNLPKIVLPPGDIDLFGENNFLRHVFSNDEFIFLDPEPTRDLDQNSHILVSLAQERSEEPLCEFLKDGPPRDDLAIICAYMNFLERDQRKKLIRLSTDKEISILLEVFAENLQLRSDVFNIRNEKFSRAWLRLSRGFFPVYEGPNRIIISDSPPTSPDQGVYEDFSDHSDEV